MSASVILRSASAIDASRQSIGAPQNLDRMFRCLHGRGLSILLRRFLYVAHDVLGCERTIGNDMAAILLRGSAEHGAADLHRHGMRRLHDAEGSAMARTAFDHID